MKSSSCDFIVVGSGIAGLRAAIELMQAGSVKVVCKGDPWESNTRWAQGGIAAAMQEGDTVEFHLQDTLNAGDGLCFEPAVRVLVEEGPRRIQELVAFGARFDRKGGRFVFGREGAHSRNRILHAGDATGKEIVRALLNWVEQSRSIELVPYKPAVDLILTDHAVAGILAMDESTGELEEIRSRAVLLATGGAGQIYSHTTNPRVATGDGLAMAYRAGADLMDLEFFQFHPTAFDFENAPRFLLTEALRGEGAVLRNWKGEAFMKKYHELADLAPRDIVSRAIVHEINRTAAKVVYLDATSIPPNRLRERFPNIWEFLQNYGFELSRDLIPVSPSAHYWMGGIRTDLQGRTSVPGLFAAGEAACTGVHGANRLASNSLLEGLVFGARAGSAMRSVKEPAGKTSIPLPESRTTVLPSSQRAQIQEECWKHAGLIRDEAGIRKALAFLESLPSPFPANLELLELRNLLDCSKLIFSFALHRQESRGSHFRKDFPARKTEWDQLHSIMQKGKITIRIL